MLQENRLYEGKMDEIVLAAKSKAEKLIFVFHGYGADKTNLRSIGEEFANVLPNAEVRLPNGIEPCDEGFGRQWFALKGDDITAWKKAFLKNESKIISYVDSVIVEKNLRYKDVIFAGFSQGAMLSISLALKLEAKAAVAFSGLLLNPELCENYRDSKIFLAHGEADDVVPFEAMGLTKKAFDAAGISCETAASPNLGHSIDDYLLSRAVDFLKKL
jgi:phospholipase/carboxylesterase